MNESPTVRRIGARAQALAVGACLVVTVTGLVQASGPVAVAATSKAVPAAPSVGCSLSQPAPSGTTDQLLAAAGDQGAYVREIPPSYRGTSPMPLVLDLHGYGESATLQATLTALGSYGDAHGFITVSPQVAGVVPMWNTSLGSKDLAFIGDLLRALDGALCIDRNRTYVAGYSNGAMMTSSIACQFAGQVAAVAPVAGIEDPAGCHPARPVPVVAFHGTADQFVPYTGGLGPAALKLPAPNGSGTLGQALGSGAASATTGPSVPTLTTRWAVRNGCAPAPQDHRVASDVTLISYRCPGSADVELYRVTGGGHAWPGSVFSKGITSVIGKVTYSISANAIIWGFFKAHPLRR